LKIFKKTYPKGKYGSRRGTVIFNVYGGEYGNLPSEIENWDGKQEGWCDGE